MQTATIPRLGVTLQGMSSGTGYLLLCALYFGVIVGFYLLDPLGFEQPFRDTWHHVAVLRELMVAPFDPSNPHLPTDEPSRYYTPLNILAAMLGRSFGISPWMVFSYSGIVTILGLVVSCWYFGKRYFESSWAPAIFISSLLLAWGTQFGHAGSHNLGTFVSSAAYPATQTLVLGIFCWFLCLFTLEERSHLSRNLIALTAITTLIIITHQFSAFLVLIGAGSFVLFHRASKIGRKAIVITAMFCGALLSLTWPYFSPLDVVLSASNSQWQSDVLPAGGISYLMVPFAPALLGVLGFRDALSKHLRWEIILPSCFLAICCVILASSGSSIAHRFPPGIMIYLQIGLTWALLSLKLPSKERPVAQSLVVVATAAFIFISIFTALSAGYYETRLRDAFGRLLVTVNQIEKHLPKNSISFATETIVYPLQATGRRVVSIPRPEPVALSLPVRQAATNKFFAAETTQTERLALLAQWNASHIAFTHAGVGEQTVQDLRALGSVREFSHGIEIISVTDSGANK